jgi:phospholipid/cholesterol/gamma-HCH transport system substrate-binding protein
VTVVRRRTAGLIVLLAISGLVALAARGWNPLAHPQLVRAELVDADGLAPIGADVRIAGVPVGTVAGVSRDGRLARVTLRVDSAQEIHRDATVALAPRLMFEGTAYVELSPGTPAAPPLGDRVIPTTQTSVYVPLEDTFAVLAKRRQPAIHAITAAGARALSGTVPAALGDAISRAPALTHDTAEVAAAAHDGGALAGAAASMAHVADTVVAQAPALASTLDGARVTLAAADADGGRPVDATLQSRPAVTERLAGGATAASAILDGLQRLTPSLTSALAAAGPAVARMRPLLRRTAPVAQRLTPLLGRAQTALAGARWGAAPARAAAAALLPTLRMFRDTLIPALVAPTDLGDPAYLSFLGLFEGGGGASRPFTIDGGGHFMRFGLRFLTGAGLPLPACSTLSALSPRLAAALGKAGGCTP